MGKEKRFERRRQREQLRNLDMPRLAAIVRNVASAISCSPGGDCYLHALIGMNILITLGVECRLTAGYAAWRVGNGNHDVLVHHPSVVTYSNGARLGFPYHTWIEVGNHILDFTTYHFHLKASLSCT
jgi:hypothetical protein